MATDVLFMGWNRSVPGREAMSAAHFQEILGWLGELQGAGKIESFEPVLLTAHGGDLNGFVLVRGDAAQISSLQADSQFHKHVTRGGHHLEGFGVVHGVTGEGVMAWMALWSEVISDT